MEPEITLAIREEREGVREARVASPRFTIGRGQENDLVIDCAGLSRQHATIEVVGGNARVADCGSRNGTFVNGRRISEAAPLKDGDVVSLGTLCEIGVRVKRGSGAAAGSPGAIIERKDQGDGERGQSQSPTRMNWTNRMPARMSPPVLAVAAIAVIVAVTVALIIARSGGEVAQEPDPGLTPDPIAASPSPSLSPCESLPLDQVETSVRQLMRSVSDDSQQYAFPSEGDPRQKIASAIKGYCGQSSLASAIGQLNQHRKIIQDQAKGRVKLAVALLAALTATDGGRRGDVVAAARQMIPELEKRRITFEGSTADSSLIAIAACQEQYDARGRHPLLARMREAVKGDLGQLNVWYLGQRRALTPQADDFVVRFLALGVIARNPRQFDVAASRLEF